MRTVAFLDGISTPIQGTCNHQDHAGVGAALPDPLHAYRAGVLKAMGCNAVRTSHNMAHSRVGRGMCAGGTLDALRDAPDVVEPRRPGAVGNHDQTLSQ